MTKMVFESPDIPEFNSDDGGSFISIEIDNIIDPLAPPLFDEFGPSVGFSSWHEIETKYGYEAGDHPWMKPFLGKRLRITVETIDE